MCLVQLGFYPHILLGGYNTYRGIVVEFLNNYLEKFRERLVTITGPKTSGKVQMNNVLSDLGEQVLDLESLIEIFHYSQDYFETVLFNKFLSYDVQRILWIVFEPTEAKIRVPAPLASVMGKSIRLHIEENLEMRIRFILQVNEEIRILLFENSDIIINFLIDFNF